MKKTFIILGIILILLIAVVWAYLFIFGAPKSTGEIFTNFGFGRNPSDTVVTSEQPSVVDTSSVTNEGKPQALKQLTTRPVVGAVFIPGGIRYVERGTGHIYDIMFSNGNESQVSVTTIPQTVGAVFSASGERVAITSEEGGVHSTLVASIASQSDGGSLVGKMLPLDAHEIEFATSGDSVYYLQPAAVGSIGYVYNPTTDISKVVFSIPLRDVRVLWGEPLYVYTTPTAQQTGHVYRVLHNRLEYVTGGGRGLMATRYASGTIVSYVNKEQLSSIAVSRDDTKELPLWFFSDKCAAHPVLGHEIFCAVPNDVEDVSVLPDAWYMGSVSFSDTFWKVNVEQGLSSLVSDFSTETGREIDVAQIGISSDGTYIYFINKNDDSLWMFDTTVGQGQQ